MFPGDVSVCGGIAVCDDSDSLSLILKVKLQPGEPGVHSLSAVHLQYAIYSMLYGSYLGLYANTVCDSTFNL